MSTDTEQLDAGHDQPLVSQFSRIVSAVTRLQSWAIGDLPERYRGWHGDISEVLGAARTWREVAKVLPPLETPVLVWTGDHSAIARRTDHNGGGWISRDYEATNPTHWQSLPDGPF